MPLPWTGPRLRWPFERNHMPHSAGRASMLSNPTGEMACRLQESGAAGRVEAASSTILPDGSGKLEECAWPQLRGRSGRSRCGPGARLETEGRGDGRTWSGIACSGIRAGGGGSALRESISRPAGEEEGPGNRIWRRHAPHAPRQTFPVDPDTQRQVEIVFVPPAFPVRDAHCRRPSWGRRMTLETSDCVR